MRRNETEMCFAGCYAVLDVTVALVDYLGWEREDFLIMNRFRWELMLHTMMSSISSEELFL